MIYDKLLNYYAELSGLQEGHTLFNADGIYVIAIFFICRLLYGQINVIDWTV